MAEWVADTLPGLGIAFTRRPVRIINRSGAPRVIGDCLMFDVKRSHPATVNNKQGDRGSCWVNVVAPNFEAAGNKGGNAYAPCVLLAEACADGAEALAWLWGSHILARVDAAGCANGDALMWNSNLSTELTSAALNAASKVVARSLGVRVGAGTVPVLFNGWHGWAKV